MRIILLCLLVILPAILTAAPIPKEKLKDEEMILGVWKMEKFETGDTDKPPEDLIKTVRFEYKKDGKLTITSSGKDKRGWDFKLDASRKLKELDIGNDNETLMLAIYELDDDTLRLSAINGTADAVRPTEFKTDAKGTFVMTFKRVVEEKK